MKPVAIAILSIRPTDADDIVKLVSDSQPPEDVEQDGKTKTRLSSDNPQVLFEFVSSLVARAYRRSRRAALGGRGEMNLGAGIALDAERDDAIQRAARLSDQAPPHVIAAEQAFVDQLDPLRYLTLDRTPRKIDGRN